MYSVRAFLPNIVCREYSLLKLNSLLPEGATTLQSNPAVDQNFVDMHATVPLLQLNLSRVISRVWLN